jgi:hypothetical protein
VFVDSQARLAGAAMKYWQGSGSATSPIRRGTQVQIIPRLPGALFNPAQIKVIWLEDYHVAEFRVAVMLSADFAKEEQSVTGSIEFRVGPLLVGEIELWAIVAGKSDPEPVGDRIHAESNGAMHTAIFPSYAHEDTSFVEKLESAYALLDIPYLRDVKELRAGDEWKPKLRALIEKADIFQLCWSEAARKSLDVESEWRHAMSLGRQGFIKPIYWQKPMPQAPEELEHLHFSYWIPA